MCLANGNIPKKKQNKPLELPETGNSHDIHLFKLGVSPDVDKFLDISMTQKGIEVLEFPETIE